MSDLFEIQPTTNPLEQARKRYQKAVDALERAESMEDPEGVGTGKFRRAVREAALEFAQHERRALSKPNT